MVKAKTISVREYVESIVGDCMHAKRILSLSNAVEGVMNATSVAVSMVGKALATARGLDARYAVKQIDRFFSNENIRLDTFFANWVPYLVKERQEIIVALDWTDFDKDDHSTIAVNLITSHGRATPLLWKTYLKSTLKGHRNDYEDDILNLLKACLPVGIRVTVLADRGFSDVAFYAFIRSLGFDLVIRFKANTLMTVKRKKKSVKEWLMPSGKACKYRDVHLTDEEFYIPAVVCVHDKQMKAAWFLATNLLEKTATEIVKLYGMRFSIEETFRDSKDIRFGMGLSAVSIKKPERRDRVLLASAIATSLLTLLGAAGEALGFDRLLKVNTVKRRTHSLLTQGSFYFGAMVNYKEEKLRLIVNKFYELINQHAVFQGLFAWV
jgi:hypothetical protein